MRKASGAALGKALETAFEELENIIKSDKSAKRRIQATLALARLIEVLNISPDAVINSER